MTWSGYSEQGTGSQERGPGGFSLQVPGAKRAEALPTPNAVQGGVRGGGVSGGLNVGRDQLNLSETPGITLQKPDPTMALLMKMGSEWLAPKIKKLEEQKFVEGMHKAASGQALLEIVNEQPGYATIFGDGAVVEGARAYTTEAQIAGWAASVQGLMPSLRERSPDEVPALLTQSLEQFHTGDADADATIKAEMIKRVPALMKEHTREHVAYLNEKAVAAQGAAFVAAGTVTQNVLRNGKATDDDKAASVNDLLATLAITPGMNVKTWAANVEGFVKNAAQSNQFVMLQGLQQRGLMGALPPELNAQLSSYVREQAKRYRSDNPPTSMIAEGNGIMAQMESGIIDLNDGRARLAALNAQYRGESGNIIDLFDQAVIGSSIQTTMKANYAARRAEAAKQATDRAAAAEVGAKAQYEQARATELVGVAEVGQLQHVVGTDKEKQEALAGAWRKAEGTDKGYFALTEAWRTGNIVSDIVQSEMQREFRGSKDAPEVTPGFVTAYQKWRQFNYVQTPDGAVVRPTAAGASAAYFGAEMDGRMQVFHQLTNQGTQLDQLGTVAFQSARAPKQSFTKEEKAGMASTLSKELSVGGIFGMFKDKPSDATMQRIMQVVEPLAQHYSGLNGEDRARAAFSAATAAGLEVWGETVLQRQPGQKALDTATGITSAHMGATIDAAFAARIKDERIDSPRAVNWTRLGGSGTPKLQAWMLDAKGEPHTIVLSGDDLKRVYDKAMTSEVDVDGPLRAGPKITFRNPDDFPGIYASPEELGAYRERQKQKSRK